MNEQNGEEVSIIRGGSSTTGVTASPVLGMPQEIVTGNSIIRIEMQDFGINSVDYQIGGTQVVPQIGDIIQRENGERFLVTSRSGDQGESPFAYTTTLRERLLVYTVKKGIA